ncbi:response regulator transcription factor [Parahaliea maris]|uniref:Response regulator transcription factor n=1 Tax=Parahaliea maris TaxID=2716870 RepID=A0A5C9A7T3_9GAMM|nr:response regulator transcription factor [Parahaliea maris]TXS95730.1 response regulator transcription factor [Parahaliea maris]
MNEHTPCTVLVVDDAPDSLSLINDTLEQAGMDTLVALEGKQALTIVKRIRPDIILLDAIMPGMDGFETCRQLKRDPQMAATPVIFMTGLTDTDSVLKGLDAGGIDYLTKPVNPNELLARIRVHLKSARITRSAQQALDSTGHQSFTVGQDGALRWATPDTLALFARLKADGEWQRQILQPLIASWLAGNPATDASLAVPAGDEQSPGDQLCITLLQVRPGEEYLLTIEEVDDAPEAARLQRALNLTARESEVLYWLANGKSNKEIGAILEISARTVNKHLEQVFTKLGVENRTAAAGIAIRALVRKVA